MKRAAGTGLVAWIVATICSTVLSAQVTDRVIYASVVTDRGEPVAGLTSKDFIVREDGAAREVLRVAKDEDPLQLALLVDNSVEMRDKVADLRRAVGAFVGSLRPGVEVALITTAERPTIVVPYTSDRAALQKGVENIVALDAGNYVLDAIAEVSQGLAKRANARSVIAIVSGRGLEYSYRDYTEVQRIVKASGTPAVHAMMVGGHDAQRTVAGMSVDLRSGQRPDGTGVDRDIILGRLTKETGGRYEDVLITSALTAKLRQLSAELSNQYRVVFASPDRLVPATKVEISARDPKLRARGMVVK
jgi:VWFA-related protein